MMLFFVAVQANGQKRIVVQVYDAQTGIPIENANVRNIETGTVLVTDAGGNCRILASAEDRISISHVSYRDTVITLLPHTNQLNIKLHALEMNAIEVYAGEAFNKKAAQGVNKVSLPFLTAVPSFLGEPDLIKGLTFLPGVSEGKEGYSHLFVRGGDQDQNQILFDGATMFNVNHFGGYISMFQPELVGGVDFYKNYWPSKFGGRLSSVLDIKTKEGNYKEHRQSLQLGLIAPKVSATGPLYKDKVSYHFGMRRTIADLITAPIARKIRKGTRTGDMGNLLSQDMTLRLDGRIGHNQHLSLSGLYSRDRYSFLENYPIYNQLSEDRYGISNELLALNYRIEVGLSTSIAAHASYSNYRHYYNDYLKSTDGSNYGPTSTNSLEALRLSGNRIRSIKFNINGKTLIGNALELNYGLEREQLAYGIYLRRNEAVEGNTISSYDDELNMTGITNTAMSADVAYQINDRLRINSGLRLSSYTFNSSNMMLAEPKILVTYGLDKNSTVNAAFNLQRQNTTLLGFTDDMGRFREFYISNDGSFPIASSKQWSAGYFRNSLGILDNISVELFYKDQSGVVKFLPSVDFDKDVLEYQDFLHKKGKVRTYGLEVLLQRTTGNIHSSLSYTFARSQSLFPSLNQGKWFNSDFDFRHSANFLMMYSFGKGYKLSGNWTYKTGRPFTMPTSRTEIEDWRSGFMLVSELNNMRLPSFHRLDINIERRWKTRKENINRFGVGVYNVYNRVNPFFAQPADTPGELEVTGMFPIMPFFNIGFEF